MPTKAGSCRAFHLTLRTWRPLREAAVPSFSRTTDSLRKLWFTAVLVAAVARSIPRCSRIGVFVALVLGFISLERAFLSFSLKDSHGSRGPRLLRAVSAVYVERVRIIRAPKAVAAACRLAARPVVLVPTMGALHAGHAALMQRARRIAGPSGTVVTSIFVNPIQFGKGEDLARYPRPFRRDAKVCADNSVDLLFHPSTNAMYGRAFSSSVEETSLSQELCGRSRPQHFRGVTTVVTKLFHLVNPDVAIFGAKDFQQLAIIRRMISDLNWSLRIAELPTVREADGLALSSRNSYLTPSERAQAPLLWAGLRAAHRAARAGERRAGALRKIVASTLQKCPDARIDYLEVVDAKTLQPLRQIDGRGVIALAVFFGKTRLIDHIEIRAGKKEQT